MFKMGTLQQVVAMADDQANDSKEKNSTQIAAMKESLKKVERLKAQQES
jgi:hypothetical protein